MRDLEKYNEVKWHLHIIKNAVESYETYTHPIYFDYESVIALLQQTEMVLTDSARCPRPANLPIDVPWNERLVGGDEVFNPYNFDGTMSVEDYEQMHELITANKESEEMER